MYKVTYYLSTRNPVFFREPIELENYMWAYDFRNTLLCHINGERTGEFPPWYSQDQTVVGKTFPIKGFNIDVHSC